MAAFTYWSAFWLFLIYPTVSVTCLRTFHCTYIGNDLLLSADFTEQCPRLDPSGFLHVLGIVTTVMYPLGIPVLILLMLVWSGVPRIAEQKRNTAAIKSLIALFKSNTSTMESADLARQLQHLDSSSSREAVTVSHDHVSHCIFLIVMLPTSLSDSVLAPALRLCT